MRTYEPMTDGQGNLLQAHEQIMEKYFDNAGIGECAKRLADKIEDCWGCRWPSLGWQSAQEDEGNMRLRWTDEPELTQAFGIEECICYIALTEWAGVVINQPSIGKRSCINKIF